MYNAFLKPKVLYTSDDDVERLKYLISSFSSTNIVNLFEFANEDI